MGNPNCLIEFSPQPHTAFWTRGPETQRGCIAGPRFTQLPGDRAEAGGEWSGILTIGEAEASS